MKSSLTEKWIVCRICLHQPKETMQTIFDKDDNKDMTRMILDCGGVPIKRFDHYPDKICDKCLRYLRVAYKFRITCQRSHNHLSQFIAPVVLEKCDVNIIPEISLELDKTSDITLKFEPENLKDDIKQEIPEEDVVDIYEPMDEANVEEGRETEHIDSHIYDEIEFLEEFGENVPSINEEYNHILHSSIKPIQSKRIFVNRTTPILKQTSFSKREINETEAFSNVNGVIDESVTLTTNTKHDKKNVKTFSLKRGPKPKKEKQNSYICDVCGNIYPSQGRLMEHIKWHKAIKPHDCEICGHAFAQTQQLARHMNTHTGNRPFKCSYCPSAFADLSTRNKHHRIHTNERPFVCDVCGKAFTYTNTLKFHKMIHTGEKPHVCDVCGKGFPQAYKLRNHKQTHDRKNGKFEKIEVSKLVNYQEANIAASQILGI